MGSGSRIFNSGLPDHGLRICILKQFPGNTLGFLLRSYWEHLRIGECWVGVACKIKFIQVMSLRLKWKWFSGSSLVLEWMKEKFHISTEKIKEKNGVWKIFICNFKLRFCVSLWNSFITLTIVLINLGLSPGLGFQKICLLSLSVYISPIQMPFYWGFIFLLYASVLT